MQGAPVQLTCLERDDVDNNGDVDIRDAFMLAKAIETKGDHELARDIEGDAHLDMDDVDRIACQAVDLGRNG